MSDLESTTEAVATEGGRLVRVPANIMGLLRQSYDTREKVLDWCLAIGAAATMAYVFRDEIGTLFSGALPDLSDGPDAGRTDDMQPNQNVSGALPPFNRLRASLYSYNLPPSRAIRYGVGPSGTMPPSNPADTPSYSTD